MPRPIVEPSTPLSNEHTNSEEARLPDVADSAVEFDGLESELYFETDFRSIFLELVRNTARFHCESTDESVPEKAKKVKATTKRDCLLGDDFGLRIATAAFPLWND